MLFFVYVAETLDDSRAIGRRLRHCLQHTHLRQELVAADMPCVADARDVGQRPFLFKSRTFLHVGGGTSDLMGQGRGGKPTNAHSGKYRRVHIPSEVADFQFS